MSGIGTLPEVRGRLTRNNPLSRLTWLRVGGPAEVLFQPSDVNDLRSFLADLDSSIPVFPLGVGSNLIVRDGGIEGIVIRLGRGFNEIMIEQGLIRAGAAALDSHVARRAAEARIDLTFLRTIPGTVGGAVRMNAGCYGAYVSDVFVEAQAVLRNGETVTLSPAGLRFAYRNGSVPEGAIITEVTLRGPSGNPEVLEEKMRSQIDKRDATQPTKDRSAGSTFRNPAGYSSTGQADDTHELKAWKLIEQAGMKGESLGGAQMSPRHANFLINTGSASAEDLEKLGEIVRKKVWETSGISLQWEVMRVGRN